MSEQSVDEILAEALATGCPDCGTPAGLWCFPAGPWSKLHGRRILERASPADPRVSD